MPVIGTAGHVDHGKTALIEALTGIDTDRLPEEKARGMTIDLGFAHFFDDEGGPVGVIDVPGHERFIRNMVAGAAGIDAALLVVAADDGWMEQTERHVQVLRALGVPIAAAALTKIDAVPVARVDEAAADTALRIEAAFGRAVPCVPVSSKAGINLNLLRRRILEGIAALGGRAGDGPPRIWIDRVFVLKGTGLVVAGSLAGGRLSRGDELFLHPGREPIRVRALQSYGREVESALPGERVALNIPRPRRDVVRGDCLAAAGAPLRCGMELVCRLSGEPGPEGAEARHGKLRDGLGIEVAAGTARRIAEIRTMRAAGFFRLALDAEAPCLPGQRIVLIRHGGADILGAATILDAGSYPPRERRLVQAACSSLGPLPGADDAERFAAALRGERDRAAKSSGRTKRRGAGGAQGAAHGAGAQGAAGHGLAASRDASTAESPGPSALAALRRIEIAGIAGIERTAALDPALRREMGPLCDAGLLVPLDTDLFVAATVYGRLVGLVLAGREPGGRFGVPDAKEATGYSRKYALPLLNRMERDGWVKRSGDERVVVKTPRI